MVDFTERTLGAFLDGVAERTPTPGGGGVAATAGALACSMARMVAAYSVGKRTEPENRARIEGISAKLADADRLMRELITADAAAYTDMTEAGKARDTGPNGESRYARAVLTAIGVPMEMAAIASNALTQMDELKFVASKYLISDLGVAAVLADACARAARYSVCVNAPEIADRGTRERLTANIDRIVGHCLSLKTAVEQTVDERLKTSGSSDR